jgi:hypothetical protein
MNLSSAPVEIWRGSSEEPRLADAAPESLGAVLMTLQWLSGIAVACVISPLTWIGAFSEVHLHVWAAILLGG